MQINLRHGGRGQTVTGNTFSWLRYWKQHKSIEYSSRSGLDFLETGSGLSLNGKIMPSCGYCDATNYATRTVANFNVGAASGYVEAKFYYDGNTSTSATYIFSSSDTALTTKYFFLSVVSGYPRMTIRGATGGSFNNVIRATATLAAGWHTVRWASTGSAYVITIDGTAYSGAGLVATTGSDNGIWFSRCDARDNIAVGTWISTGVNATQSAIKVAYIDVDNAYKWYFTGVGLYEYDIIGDQHLTWTGAAHKSYDTNASQALLDSGYSRWIKTAAADEIVPYKGGAAFNVAAFLTGYVKQTDNSGSLTSHNKAPSLIDMDYTDATPARLAVMDRSNTTYHAAASRAASDYDASNPYRYEASNFADPRILKTFFNTGYKGRFYPDISVTGNNVMTIDGAYLTDVDLTASKQKNAMVEADSFVLAEYPNGSYTTDADGYLEYHDIAYSDDFGTSAAKTAYENSTIINGLVTGGTYRKVVIGSVASDVYLISQPIVPSNCDIDYCCVLKMMDSVTDTLAQNIVAGATTFTATDASKFHTGEYVCVTDNDQAVIYDLYRGWGGKIINIAGNVITLDTIAPYNYTAASTGRIATIQSNILIDSGSYVTIGSTGGYIDNNKAGQSAIHPTYFVNGTIVEAYKQGCCIAGWKSNHVTIQDAVTVKNAKTHGISFSSDYVGTLNTNLSIGAVHVNDCHQKGLHFKWTNIGTLGNAVIDGSVWEDGIIFYSTNTNWTVGSVTCTNCGRTGFNWNSSNNTITIANITTSGCTDFGFDCGSKNLTVTGKITTSDRVRFNQAYPTGGGVSGISIAEIDIDNCVKTAATSIVWFYGNVKTVTITKLTLDGCTGKGVVATVLSGGYPDDIRINSGGIYTHTGTKTDIAVGSDVIMVGDFT
jgi:hypothetical protein